MNLAVRGIDARIAGGDSVYNDCRPDLKTGAANLGAAALQSRRNWGLPGSY